MTRGIELVHRLSVQKVYRIVHTPDRLDVARTRRPFAREVRSLQKKDFLTLACQFKVPVLDLIDAWKDRPGIARAFRDELHLSSEEGSRSWLRS